MDLTKLVKSNQMDWKPLLEDGIVTTGVSVKILRFDESSQRPPTILLKFAPGASYPNHIHPAGEEAFLLEGEVRFGKHHLYPGDYLYTAPGETHAVFSRTGCILLLVIPEEVEILKNTEAKPC